MAFGDAVHPRAVIQDGPSGFHQRINEDIAGYPVRDTQTAQSARVFSSGEGAFGFAHFAIHGNHRGIRTLRSARGGLDPGPRQRILGFRVIVETTIITIHD